MPTDSPKIEVGKEYVYIGQFVKVLEVRLGIRGDEAVVETRFGDRTTCDVDELDEKPERKTSNDPHR